MQYPIELFSEPLIGHLQNRGWTLMESEPDIAVLRRNIIGGEEEIVLPIDRTYADYQQRIQEVIRFLAKSEQISESDIIQGLVPQRSDVLRVRITGERIEEGSIPFLDKRVIEEGLRKILIAAARSVLDHKAYFKRLYSAPVEQWLRTCRSGKSEAGSYILTVQLPLEEGCEDSLSRKVTEYLMGSLKGLVELSEKSDLSIKDKCPDLNANFCLGLAEMKPDEGIIHFDFQMKWSSEVPMNKNIPSKIEIKDHQFSSFLRIGEGLKPLAEVSQDIFIGKILTLNGRVNESGSMEGEVTLSILLDEEQVKARGVLGPEFYLLACEAHTQNMYIQISGILSEKPRCFDIKNISHFEIIAQKNCNKII